MLDLEQFSNVKNLETFCGKILKCYIENLFDPAILMKNHFEDQLIWLQILKSSDIRQVLTSAFINNNLGDDSNDDDNVLGLNKRMHLTDVHEKIFLSSVSSLQLYVITNFLVYIDRDLNKTLDDCVIFLEDFLDLECKELNIPTIDYSLDVDGETLVPLMRCPQLLKLSRFLLKFLKENNLDHFTGNPFEHLNFLIWSLRSAIIHQFSLNSTTGTLYTEVSHLIKQIEFILQNDKNLNLDNQLKMSFYIEIANIFTCFGDQENSKKFLSLAKKFSNITFELIGRMGVRTHFQTKPTSQLMVMIKRINDENLDENTEDKITISMPKNEKSEDSTLLEEVRFTEKQNDDDRKPIKLTPNEQALMITSIKYLHRFGASKDPLLREEILTYINFLLQNCDQWVMHYNLLDLRSNYERDNRKRVERSLKQLETLRNETRHYKGSLNQLASQRIRYFYSVLCNPYWKIDKHYANLLFSLGLYKTALSCYLGLQQWKEAIECYRQMGMTREAEELIKKKLEENPNQPDMLCLLGEVTGNIEFFLKSWEMSKHRYAQAAKMLGLHYFKEKDYDQSLEWFWESVNVNSMQIDVWYRMGFIGLIQQDWDLAVMAYRRVLQFDQDSFEAWNNLSKAYIKLGDKERAMKTLQEAIKCNFEQWKIWENYIAVCADLGEVNEIIEAWHRLIDLKGKYLDDQIADILIKCVQEDGRLISKALELFARITCTSPGTPITWQLYARLMMLANRSTEDSEKIQNYLQKSQRQILTSGWEKDIDKAINVLEHYKNLSCDIFEFAEKESEDVKRNVLNTLKQSSNSILVLIRKTKLDFPLVQQSEKMANLESKIDALQKIHDQTLEKLSKQ